jgi:hypothetical protein
MDFSGACILIGAALLVNYCGAICVDFCGNRTTVKVDSPSYLKARGKAPITFLGFDEYGISPMPESHRVENSVQSRDSRN